MITNENKYPGSDAAATVVGLALIQVGAVEAGAGVACSTVQYCSHGTVQTWGAGAAGHAARQVDAVHRRVPVQCSAVQYGSAPGQEMVFSLQSCKHFRVAQILLYRWKSNLGVF